MGTRLRGCDVVDEILGVASASVSTGNTAGDASLVIPAEYLEVVITKRSA